MPSIVSPRAIAASILVSAAAAVSAAVVGSAALAGTPVDVTVVDSDNSPVRGAGVTLHFDRESFRARSVQTDVTGHALFADVEPGSYGLSVGPPRGENLVRVGALYPPPRGDLTVAAGDPPLALRVVMTRGGRVVLDARGAGGFPFPSIGASLREVFTGETVAATIRQAQRSEVVLPPGRWTITPDAPDGWLPRGVEIGGARRADDVVELDVAPTQTPVFVTFHFLGEAKIEGRVTGPHVAIVAARATGEVRRVSTRPRPDGTYEMIVPAGAWTVAPDDPHLSRSEPPAASVDLAAGATARADFEVERDAPRPAPWLEVFVQDPEGGHVDGAAVVEARREPVTDRDGPPAARVRTDESSSADLPLSEPGEYEIRAFHPDFLPGTAHVSWDPDADVPPLHVALAPAAGVAARALDADGRPVPGVEVRLDPCGTPPPEAIDDGEFLARKNGPRRTDYTGRARLRGREAGCWRLSATYGRAHLVRVRDDGRDRPRAELELRAGETREVDLRVVPAASVRLNLECAGGEPLPAAVEWRAVDAFADDERGGGPAARGPRGLAVLGPLEEGTARLGVRPAGFDAWTFWPSTEDLGRAARLTLEPGPPYAPGTLVVDCAPRVTLVPDDGPPGVERAYPEGAISFAAALVAADGARHALEVEPRGDGALQLSGLPETTAPARLQVTVGYPLVLREPYVTLEAEAPALRRGARLDLPLAPAPGDRRATSGPGPRRRRRHRTGVAKPLFSQVRSSARRELRVSSRFPESRGVGGPMPVSVRAGGRAAASLVCLRVLALFVGLSLTAPPAPAAAAAEEDPFTAPPAAEVDVRALPPVPPDPAAERDRLGNPLTRPDGARLLYAAAAEGLWHVREVDADGVLRAEYRHEGAFEPDALESARRAWDEAAQDARVAGLAFDPLVPPGRDRLHPRGLLGDFKRGAGAAGLVPLDWDLDGTLELIDAREWYWVVMERDGDGFDPAGPGHPSRGRLTSIAVVPTAAGQPARLAESWSLARVRLIEAPGGRVLWDTLLSPHSTGYATTAVVAAQADADAAVELFAGRSDGQVCRLDGASGAVEACASTGFGYLQEMAAGDIDGDGTVELVLSGSGPAVVVDAVTLKRDPVTLAYASRAALADVDGDGVPDVVTAYGSYDYRITAQRGDGRVIWTRTSYYSATAFTLVDADSDGDVDVVSAEGQTGILRALDGRTGAELFNVRGPASYPSRLVAADFDHDGRLEYVWTAYTYSGVRSDVVVVERGGPTWRNPVRLGRVSLVGDADVDGTDELVVIWAADKDTNLPAQLELRDLRTLRAEGPRVPILPDLSFAPAAAALADVDRDGRPDLVVGGAVPVGYRAAGTLAALRFSGEEIWRWSGTSDPIAGAVRALLLQDVDGDGAPEILTGGVKEDNGSFVSARAARDGRLLWRSAAIVGYQTSADVVQLQGFPDGRIVATGSAGTVVLLTPDGRVSRRIDVAGDGVAVADHDGDGTVEIVAFDGVGSSYDVEVAWIDAATGTAEWWSSGTLPGWDDEALRVDAVPGGRVLATTRYEPVSFTEVARVALLDARPGATPWDGTLENPGTSVGVTPLARDVDGDGRLDLLLEWPGLTLFATADGCPAATEEAAGDRDLDGLGDACDACPDLRDAPPQRDLDGDGAGDACDGDDDGDGWPDAEDRCPRRAGAANDDADGDGHGDACDVCPAQADPAQQDGDRDGIGDACDADDDGDGVPDGDDRCPGVPGGGAGDLDRDGLPDLCDPDDDGDGVPDARDNCVLVANADQRRSAQEGLGDACSPDDDRDLVPDKEDRCPTVPDPAQADADRDGRGDVCDPDPDGDGLAAAADVCPLAFDPPQADTDADGTGDACDPTPEGAPLQRAAFFPNLTGRSRSVPVAVADLDGDGRDEWIVGGLGWTSVTFDPATAQPRLLRGSPEQGRPLLADADGDGRVELFVVGSKEVVRSDPASGRELARGPWSGPPYTTAILASFADGNRDGRLDLYLPAANGIEILDAVTLARTGGRKDIPTADALGAGDVDGDGTVELVTGRGAILDATTFEVEATVPSFVTGLAAMLDVDADGRPEPLFRFNSGLMAWDHDRGGPRWFRAVNGGNGSSVTLADEAVGQPVLAAYMDYALVFLDPPTGNVRRRVTVEAGTVLGADVDGDGLDEVVCPAGLYDPQTGAWLFQTVSSDSADPTAAYADVDGDGSLDLVLSAYLDRTGVSFTGLDAPRPSPPAPWPVGGVPNSLRGLAGADLDGDGARELLVTGYGWRALRLPTLASLWTANLDAPLMDVARDDDGALLLANNRLAAGASGAAWWSWPDAWYPRDGALLDANGDRRADVAMLASDGSLTLDDGLTGVRLAGPAHRAAGLRSIAADDAGPSGRRLLAGAADGRILVLHPSNLGLVSERRLADVPLDVHGTAAPYGEIVASGTSGGAGGIGGTTDLYWADPVSLKPLHQERVGHEVKRVLIDRRPEGGRFVLAIGTYGSTLFDVDGCAGLPGIQRADADRDGVGDGCDTCPASADPSNVDLDGDGAGDACDGDDDGDGIPDAADDCPQEADPGQADADGDGAGDACDACPAVPEPAQTDTDRDGSGDACDADDDGDGTPDVADVCPRLALATADLDGDGSGDACDDDDDGDGFADAADLCPSAAGPTNADTDYDGRGDACDADDDGDGAPDEDDACPLVPSAGSGDADGDGAPDACDADRDGDGAPDLRDACPSVADDQRDRDRDGLGDACDPQPRGPALRVEATRGLAACGEGLSAVPLGDGRTALLETCYQNRWQLVAPGSVTGAHEVLLSSSAVSPLPGGKLCALGAGDVDRDGRSEVLLVTQQGIARIALDGRVEAGVAHAASDVCSYPDAALAFLRVLDLDRDGRQEIVYGNYGGFSVLDGPTLRVRGTVATSSSGFAVGDLDGDRRLEIVAAGQSSVTVYDGATLAKRLTSVLGDMRRPLLLDADGDGRDELYALRAVDYSGYTRAIWRWNWGSRALVRVGETTTTGDFLGAGPRRNGRATLLVVAPTYPAALLPVDALSGVAFATVGRDVRRGLGVDIDGDGVDEIAAQPPLALHPVSGPAWAYGTWYGNYSVSMAVPTPRAGATPGLVLSYEDAAQRRPVLEIEGAGNGVRLRDLPLTLPSAEYPLAAADRDGDGALEIVVRSGPWSGAQLFREMDGRILFDHYVPRGPTLFTDWDADGTAELAVIDYAVRLLGPDDSTPELSMPFDFCQTYAEGLDVWPPPPARPRRLLAWSPNCQAVYDLPSGTQLVQLALRPVNRAAFVDWDEDGEAEVALVTGYVGGASASVAFHRADTGARVATVPAPKPFRGMTPLPPRGRLALAVDGGLLLWDPRLGNAETLPLASPVRSGVVAADLDGDRRHELSFVSGAERFRVELLSTVHPPVAGIVPAPPTECRGPLTAVPLDAGASRDDDSTPGTRDDLVAYRWSRPGPGGVTEPLGTGERLVAPLPLGITPVTLEVEDSGLDLAFTTRGVEVVDTTPPRGSVTFPPAGACFGPAALPVVVTDDAADVCDAGPLARTYAPGPGPAYDAHGDHPVVLEVRDASANAARLEVPFTIDRVAPRARIEAPRQTRLNAALPLRVLLASGDDDGAAGDPSRERLFLGDCLLLDGAEAGDRDGRLVDETIVLDRETLCGAARRCGLGTVTDPPLRFTVEDCGGNGTTDAVVLKGTATLVGGICGR